MIRFIHAADLHLDSAFGAMSADRAAERRKELREIPGRLSDYVNEKGVGLVLLAGDLFDSSRAYRETEQRHLEQFHRLLREIRRIYPQALGLGSGGCRVCARCAWPEPCRFPLEACASMEGYGLFVTQVCRDNGCQYNHGEKTITYTACILF